MNYLEQIVAFQRWKDVNPLPASAIALWYELMATCNKAGWPEEFTVQNALLQATAGLSRKEFDRARQILIDLGRIHYTKSKRVNMAGKYQIIPFPIVQKGQQNGQQKDQREGQREEHKRDNDRGNVRDILKDKYKQKQNETLYTVTKRDEPATVADAFCLAFGKTIIPPNVQAFIVPLIEQYGERYVIELILETGEAAHSPSLRYMQSTHEAWQRRGITSREQAKLKKGGEAHATSRGSPPRGRGEYDSLSL